MYITYISALPIYHLHIYVVMSSASKVKQRWTEEQDDELRTLFEQYKEQPEQG